MSNLGLRIVTAIFGLALFIFMLFYNYSTFAILFMVLNFVCLFEFFNLINKHSNKNALTITEKRSRLLYSLLGTFIYLATVLGLFINAAFYFAVPLSLFFLWYDGRKIQTNVALWKLLTGYVYLTWPFLVFTFLAFYNNAQTFQPLLVLCFFLMIWSNDVFAYFVGRKFGKTALAKTISPNKTVEGFLGGFAGSLLIGFLAKFIFPEIGWHFLPIALIVGIAGPAGDLFESALKRKACIKDSGNILPGHGGILDRFDAAILAAPFVFLYLLFVLV